MSFISYLMLFFWVKENICSEIYLNLDKMSNQTPSWAHCSSWPCLSRVGGPEGLRGSLGAQLLCDCVTQLAAHFLGSDHRAFGVPLMNTLVLVIQIVREKHDRVCLPDDLFLESVGYSLS